MKTHPPVCSTASSVSDSSGVKAFRRTSLGGGAFQHEIALVLEEKGFDRPTYKTVQNGASRAAPEPPPSPHHRVPPNWHGLCGTYTLAYIIERVFKDNPNAIDSTAMKSRALHGNLRQAILDQILGKAGFQARVCTRRKQQGKKTATRARPTKKRRKQRQ